MPKIVAVDIETYSFTDLKKASVYKYTEDPTFEVMMCAWNDGGQTWIDIGEEEILATLRRFWHEGAILVAHNAAFERICFSRLLGMKTGTYLPSNRFIDTQIIAAEIGLPRGLANLAKALGVEEKDSAGTHLINYFCKPYRGKRRFPEDSAEAMEKWLQFIAYCIQDVDTLVAVYQALKRLPQLTEEERRNLEADQAINDRGIKVDTALAEIAVIVAERNAANQKDEVRAITGVENPNSGPQLLAWLNAQPIPPMPDLKKETVQEYLDGELPTDVRRVLELRQHLALVASKKFISALANTSEDGRLRGGFRFFGAHTGRWAGRGVQLHNLPRLGFQPTADDYLEMEDMWSRSVPKAEIERFRLDAIATVTEKIILRLLEEHEATAEELKMMVRPLFTGPFTVVDYSAIEARVLAWLAGEKWVLQAFEENRDIYVETAERMGGLTRSQGKVAVLALGFNGGIDSLMVMAGGALKTEDGRDMTESEMWDMVNLWRDTNPRIVRMWKALEQAFRNGGGRVGRLIVTRRGNDMYMRLPSGRSLVYRNMQVESFYDTMKERVVYGLRFDDPRGFRQATYGGRLAENATQATARDILAAALTRLEARGYQVVGHVHDEVLVEGKHDISEVSSVMCESPIWANGLPLAGEGFNSSRYMKG